MKKAGETFISPAFSVLIVVILLWWGRGLLTRLDLCQRVGVDGVLHLSAGCMGIDFRRSQVLMPQYVL